MIKMMTMLKLIINSLFIVIIVQSGYGQKSLNPVIKDFGGIWDIPEAMVTADKQLDYKIVIDVNSGPDSPDELNPALNNVARMLNLHAVAGAGNDKMHVVLAIHASATYAIMNNKAYRVKYGTDNPNLALIRQLNRAGVELTVCGQSLIAREVPIKDVQKEVEVATSMLTTVTMYQNKGYAYLRF
jgi:intracellular sulfur oxidation DsrE/DsrF family protein